MSDLTGRFRVIDTVINMLIECRATKRFFTPPLHLPRRRDRVSPISSPNGVAGGWPRSRSSAFFRPFRGEFRARVRAASAGSSDGRPSRRRLTVSRPTAVIFASHVASVSFARAGRVSRAIRGEGYELHGRRPASVDVEERRAAPSGVELSTATARSAATESEWTFRPGFA